MNTLRKSWTIRRPMTQGFEMSETQLNEIINYLDNMINLPFIENNFERLFETIPETYEYLSVDTGDSTVYAHTIRPTHLREERSYVSENSMIVAKCPTNVGPVLVKRSK